MNIYTNLRGWCVDLDSSPDTANEPTVRTSKHQTKEALFNMGGGRRRSNKNNEEATDATQKLPSFNKNYVQFTDAVKHFSTVDVVDGLMERVRGEIGGKTLPTSIQSLAMMTLLGDAHGKQGKQGKQTLLAAETGSGKTYAFLIPMIDALKRSEVGAAPAHKAIRKPRALIMAPTRELCRQLTGQVKALTHICKLKSTYVWSAGEYQDENKDKLEKCNDDVLIGSPEQLNKLHEKGVSFDGVEWVVLDEADALFDDDFVDSTEKLVRMVEKARVDGNLSDNRSGNLNLNLVMSTATVNEKFSSYLHTHYPRINRLVSPKTHTLPRALKLSYAPYHSGNKLADLRGVVNDLISGSGKSNNSSKQAKTLVFVNTNERAEKVAKYFNEKGTPAVSMTSASQGRSRVSNRPIRPFLRGGVDISSSSGGSNGSGDNSNNISPASANTLVTTSLLARGLDFGTHVQNVVIAEESGSAVDFIHRAGRTGRAGAQGHVTVMVPLKKYQHLSRRGR
ncbi:hypothetical protein E3P98_01564 [Wallemia ichthyophaga]|nr:hypothetical protein E3P98_01564 [Wallemia ichthyophaga]